MSARQALALSALFLLVSAQPLFSLWSQGANVSVVDTAGMPVKYADVLITYQKSVPFGAPDGRVQGRTGDDGSFYAVLSNSVPSGKENRTYAINVSTYYWKGSITQFEADNSEERNLQIPIPFELESVQVRAVPFDGLPPGAQATIYGTDVSEPFNASGVAVLRVPMGLKFSGYVVADGFSKLFSSDNAPVDKDGHRTIDVLLSGGSQPSGGQGDIPASAQRITAQVAFFGPDGTPFANQPVNYFYRGKQQTAMTGADGVAGFDGFAGFPINISVVADEYEYDTLYVPNESGLGTIRIPRLLTITAFPPVQEGGNCYRVIANVSDPRKQLPLTVSFTSSDPSSPNLTSSTDESGMFFTHTCIGQDTTVTISASNKYDSAQAAANLTYAAPAQQGGEPAQPVLPNLKNQTDNSFLWAIIAVFISIIAAGVFFAKRQLGASFGFILNYLRMVYRSVQNTRRPTPAAPSKAQPSQPEPSQQPIDLQQPKQKKGFFASILPARKEKPGDDGPQEPAVATQAQSSSQPLWQPEQSRPKMQQASPPAQPVSQQPAVRPPSQAQAPQPISQPPKQPPVLQSPQQKPVQPPLQPQTPPQATPKPPAIQPPKLPPKK